jgi:hypothetical protein
MKFVQAFRLSTAVFWVATPCSLDFSPENVVNIFLKILTFTYKNIWSQNREEQNLNSCLRLVSRAVDLVSTEVLTDV